MNKLVTNKWKSKLDNCVCTYDVNALIFVAHFPKKGPFIHSFPSADPQLWRKCSACLVVVADACWVPMELQCMCPDRLCPLMAVLTLGNLPTKLTVHSLWNQSFRWPRILHRFSNTCEISPLSYLFMG